MSDPIVDPSDLATYMQLTTINEPRAAMLIADAQALCEAIVSPLPVGADQVVRRAAAAAYTNPSGAKMTAIGSARIEYGTSAASTRGVVLTSEDTRDLRLLAGGSGAFSVDLLAGYTAPELPPWDAQYVPTNT